MPETKLKPLHLGKSVADLKSHFSNVTGIIKGRKIKMLQSTAQKLHDEAEKHKLDGDEELGYVCYMKYLTIVTAVQHSDEYKQDKDYFLSMLGKQNVKGALDNAEKLCKSLEQRYKLMKEQEEIDKKQLEIEEKDAKEQLRRKEKIVDEPAEESKLVNGLPGISGVSISSKQLYNLLKEKKMNVLILDSRSASCYAKSRMNIGNCINVPEEIVKPGSSAAAVEKLLPAESKAAWSKRREADYVVLLDWSTTEKSHQQGTNLYTLKSILLKWDPGIIYKNDPLILEGGYEDWLMTYPMCTTNPKIEAPSQTSLSTLDDLLDDIQYPNLNDSPALIPQPTVDRTSKPQIGKGNVSVDNIISVRVPTPVSVSSGGQSKITTASTEIIGTSDKPGVDRTSKAYAMQTYEERSRIASEILLARQKLAELDIETKLKSETSEILRLNKEKEAEEERVAYLQSREEDLLLNISKLEESYRDQEAEKQVLKEQLEKYKQQEAEDLLEQENARKLKEEAEAMEEKRKIQEAKEREEMQEKERSMAGGKGKSSGSDKFRLLLKPPEERQKAKEVEKTKKMEEEKRREREKGRQDYERGGTYYTQLKSDMPSGSNSMKRSHSSPNIAQMMDEELVAKNKVPQFDRAIKPLHKPQPSEINAARQRNFNAVYGNLGRGLTGLKNLGNSCYMNSIIQCINNTTPLAFYFVEGCYRDDVNYHKSNTRGEVAEEVAAVIRALWSRQYRSIACRDLKSVVGQYRKQFQGYEQQDSHEFLTILMDWLHEDLNKLSGKSPLKEARTENMSPADRAWEKFKKSNESLIQTLFYGQQRSTVCCCKCGKESETYEAFSDLSLPLPSSSNKCSLKDCMQLYLNGERISGWNCPSCKDKRDAIKKFDIWKFPPILVIHLNRFYHDGWWRKRQTYVDFPFTMDVRQFTPVQNQRYVSYNLYGVSNHYGSMEGGHYTAYCKNHIYSKWYKFDDHEVSEISNSDVRTGAAYILFYASVEYQVPGSNS